MLKPKHTNKEEEKIKWKDRTNKDKVVSIFSVVFMMSFIISCISIVGGSIGFGLFYIHSLQIAEHPFSFVLDTRMKVYSAYDRNNSYVINVTEFCAPFGEASEQAECVVEQTCSMYNATMRNDSVIRTPDELILEGGLCRDYAVFVDAIMNNLDWDTDFIFSKNHVYNAMYKDNTYCSINACYYHCDAFN